ncbi:50S ribosomal protein L21 [Ruegeria sp. ANG-S4]|uniref:DUF2059 domain-containing protein n=1 Tax=Ruegeria sp. ANG-S4 TaxID=1577904 RepID=UPI00057F36CC|nr:DUF2059 domain-containing protein [Ruegeria sp. ANG-S4]KIC44375.1 50S ribosomal protein L21 [Ruegeria sp. ANG-S4]
MRYLIASIVTFAFWAAPVIANEKVNRLMSAMQVQDVMEIMGKEGRAQGDELNRTVLNGMGGTFFRTQIEDIYDPVWMQDQMTATIGENMDDGQLEQAALFFESDLGQTIVSLENSARSALMDDAIDEMARDAYRQFDRDTSFFKLIDEYVHVNDLVEQNVQGSLSADFNFYLGMSSGQATPVDGDALLSHLLTQKSEVTEETETWIYSFLLMAYQPLSEAQMRENIAFSRTDTGRALNEALFLGFDDMIDAISYRLGEAVAHAMNASDL